MGCDGLKDLEKAKNMADQNNRTMQAQIQAIQGQIDQVKWDKGAADRDNLQLIEFMCKRVSWLPFAFCDHTEFKDSTIRSVIGRPFAANSTLLLSISPLSHVGL